MPVAVRAKLLPRARRLKSSKLLFTQLDAVQQSAVEFAIEETAVALFFEQGTGKTWITGGIVERLFGPSYVGLLVVPLANLESTWLKLFREQLPQVPVYRTWEAFKIAPAPKQLLIHYEALKPKKLIEKVRRVRYTFIGFDEAQRLKNRSSLESRCAAKLRDSADYKVILTGTPMDENPSDLWAQFRFLNPDILGTVWKDFENEFLEPIDAGLAERFAASRPGSFKWKLAMRQMRIASNKRSFDLDKLDDFLELIGPCSMRVTKDYLNLPTCHTHMVPIKLRGEQARVYKQLSRTMVASLGDTGAVLTTPLRVTQLGRLQQICGGYVADDTGDIHEVGRAKLRAAKRIAARHDKPIVIFCRFLEEVWSLQEELSAEAYDAGRPIVVAVITGKNRKQRPQIIEDFQAGLIDILICQIKTGGVGIDLFRASVAIFYSITYSFIDLEQAIARLHRRGQDREVHLFLLFAAGTVDEAIYSTILQKRKITSKVLISLEHRRWSDGQGKDEHQEGRSGGKRRDRVQVWRRRPGCSPRHRTGERPGRAA